MTASYPPPPSHASRGHAARTPAERGYGPRMTDTAWLDACALADLVRTREASPAELVAAATDRIRAADPALGVLVTDRFEAAAAEAGSDVPDGPLRGVPTLLK